ncbi:MULTISPECIES: hypothetical protein [unclassified Lactococcus]|uniref:hypothetical protein n=1 Tax=unclassified Lactococcus TaxID=2643510 RepID=UPI0011C802F7|nr:MULTISPECIES: hypothetical protein [unclassified Lactococcus]MQW24007.1 hypothetical protein [Lactococcus sp. dk101]TXK36772.1 hypothetical protein FVP42_10750 [Lactococcus sp. dk310]TXK47534.1 hypothetical protein FVP43_10095 [Lactococcus sp. dk322]
MQQIIVISGAMVYLLANFQYILATIKGRLKPNRMSWFLWSLAPFIAVVASLSTQFSWTQLPVFMSGMMPFLIFIGTFFSKEKYFELTRLDILCALTAILALVGWGLSKDANIAIILSIVSDAIGGIPTLVNAIKHPRNESPLPFASGLVATLSGAVAIQTFTFSEIAFPIYLVILDVTMTIVTSRKYFSKKQK